MGKFSHPVDEYVYQQTMDGPDESVGDVSEGGTWYGLMRGAFTPDPTEIGEFGLTDEDVQMLAETAGCIVSEDTYGFVSVSFYDDLRELNRTWKRIEQDHEGDDEDGD